MKNKPSNMDIEEVKSYKDIFGNIHADKGDAIRYTIAERMLVWSGCGFIDVVDADTLRARKKELLVILEQL